MADFDPAFDVVLKQEGGIADDPADPGGVTKYGICLRSYSALGRDGILNLTVNDAHDIYLRDFWANQPYCQFAYQSIATKVFSLAVNMGHVEAHKLLQRALNDCGEHLVVDGVIGELTIFAVNRCDEDLLLEALRYQARNFYLTLVARRPSSSKFLDGWLRRAMA